MRSRALIWSSVTLIAVADALLATPIGLSLLYFVVISAAGYVLRTLELVVLALGCAAARLAFGPIGDPLGLTAAALHVGESAQTVANAVLSASAYLATALVFRQLARQRSALRVLHTETRSDPLTRLANRRRLDELLGSATAGPGTVLVVDVDHFKRINDTLGHDAGDTVLRELAGRLLGSVRGGDLVARTGGEEFVVVLPGAPAQAGQNVAERILRTVRETAIEVGTAEPVRITVSVGCTTGQLGHALVASSDRALYRAKHEGRDRVVVGEAV